MNMFKEFNKQYGIEKIEPTKANLLKVMKLIQDEVNEAIEEIEKPDFNPNAFAKELSDVRYITGERMTALGYDVTAIDNEVHRSNMSKSINDRALALHECQKAEARYPFAYIDENDGVFILRDSKTGKVIKPTTYSAAVITEEMVGLD